MTSRPLEQCTAACPVIRRPFHIPPGSTAPGENASACGKRTKAWRSVSKQKSPPVKTPAGEVRDGTVQLRQMKHPFVLGRQIYKNTK